jgi:diguanylate cyclase (GGDEF)-like protein
LETGATTAILGADLDGFKQANDQFGHAAGDKLLQAVGAKLATNIGPEDLVARIGGDEFLIVLKNAQPEAVAAVADRLIRSVAAEPFIIDGEQIAVGMSVGYACYPDDAAGLEKLKLCADHALYAAKRSGKGIALRYVPSMSHVPVVSQSSARHSTG